MVTGVPTLTTTGWVNDVVNKAVTLFDYFLASDHSQTEFFPDRVSSLPWLVQQHGHAPRVLASSTQTQLQRFYGRYFDQAFVEVNANDNNNMEGRYNLQINVAVEQDGKRHSLGRLIEVGESRILKVVEDEQ